MSCRVAYAAGAGLSAPARCHLEAAALPAKHQPHAALIKLAVMSLPYLVPTPDAELLCWSLLALVSRLAHVYVAEPVVQLCY